MKQVNVYRVVCKVNGMVHGRMRVACENREQAQGVGRVYLEKRGYVQGFNAEVDVSLTNEEVFVP